MDLNPRRDALAGGVAALAMLLLLGGCASEVGRPAPRLASGQGGGHSWALVTAPRAALETPGTLAEEAGDYARRDAALAVASDRLATPSYYDPEPRPDLLRLRRLYLSPSPNAVHVSPGEGSGWGRWSGRGVEGGWGGGWWVP